MVSIPIYPTLRKIKATLVGGLYFGGAEPRLNSADISRDFLAKLPKTEVETPNPTFRVFIIGRKVLNYCGNFGAEV